MMAKELGMVAEVGGPNLFQGDKKAKRIMDGKLQGPDHAGTRLRHGTGQLRQQRTC